MFDPQMLFVVLVLAFSVSVLVRGEVLARRDRAARFSRYAELDRKARAGGDLLGGGSDAPALTGCECHGGPLRRLPCRCVELSAPGSGSLLSAGTDNESRNDEQLSPSGSGCSCISDGGRL